MSDFLQSHGLQDSRLPCPSLCSKVCSNSCLLSRWCHPTIWFSVSPFSSCPQSFPMSRLFTSGGHSIGASASASVLPMNIQCWFPLELTGFISLLSKGLSSLVQHHNSKTSLLGRTRLLEKPELWLYGLLSAKWYLCFLIHCLALSQLFFKGASIFNFMAAVTVHSDFGVQENKICHCFHFFPIYLPWSDGNGCHDLSFLNLEF